jgi:hypothetical protein
MGVRSEIESKLLQFATTQIPQIPVAVEGVEFVKPANGRYMEIMLLDTARNNRNVAADGVRVSGMFQINCYAKSGYGMGEVEALRDAVMALYPVIPKMNSVSIEAPLSATKGYPVDTTVCISVTGQYRVEL